MASDAAPLELNDILLSLDSHLNPDSSSQSLDTPCADLDRQSRSSTPEPPDEHEVIEMRMRALHIRDGKGKGKEDTFLSELVDMILRLTAAAPARLQVLEQAATIRRLSLQQEFLLQRMDDERAIWEAEKESMQRICEALIAQANIASHTFYKEQDSTKKPAVIEAENVTLRTKLADAQARVSSLEAELAQLRPLLLMQPSAIAQSKGLILSPGRPRKKEDASSISGNAENRNYYRVREERASVNSTPSKGKKKKAISYFKHAPTVADARSEHLLLAARKLGKERASLLSQAIYRPADPQVQGPSTAPNHELTMHIKGSAGPSRPLMTPAVWPNHIQHPQQQARQGGQQPGIPGPVNVKGQQNPPFSQYAPPTGMTYPQQYFVSSGTVPRPGTAVPFYHAPPRGYIPGPAWPYYSPGPYAYGQPIPIPSVGANANKAAQGRPATSPPVAGPSKTPAPGTPGTSASSSGLKGTEKGSTSSKGETSSSGRQQEKRLKTPQSKTGSAPRNPPTPMDSLLSAAQSVFSPNARGRSPSVDGDGSPAPKKRRRVERRRGQQAPVPEAPSNLERQASALDVLADQAAGVGSSQRSRSTSRSREGSGSTAATKKPGEKTAAANVDKPAAAPSAKGAPRATAARRAKRTTRASSTTPALGTSSSLAPSVTVQRAVSEEHTAASGSAPPADSFKPRPIQLNTAARINAPGRAASLPRTGTLAGAGRGRQTNGRASTPLRPSLTPATLSVDADIDAEGDEVESEDDMDADADADADPDAEVDELHHNTSAPKDMSGRKGKGPAGAVDSGEDVNSRRWLEILGRKDS